MVIKPPPGLTCDATTRSVTVKAGERAVVNFACVGNLKGAILGYANNEFGVRPFSRVSVAGPVDRETVTNADGFFAFEDLPPGEYLLGPCNPRQISVRDSEPAYGTVDCS